MLSTRAAFLSCPHCEAKLWNACIIQPYLPRRLQQQRQQLSGSEDYQRWHMTNKLKTPHLATLPPSDLDPWASGSRASTSSTDLLLGRQLQEL
eukprot:scaffold6811_cov17-Tisochrysis_lutea.AAC.1